MWISLSNYIPLKQVISFFFSLKFLFIDIMSMILTNTGSLEQKLQDMTIKKDENSEKQNSKGDVSSTLNE